MSNHSPPPSGPPEPSGDVGAPTRRGRRAARSQAAHDLSVPQVAAILVVADGEEWLPGVLATLARTRYEGLELVVVDNASTDRCKRLLEKRMPPDRLLVLSERIGFGRAVSAALNHFPSCSDADYVWLLHDDMVCAADALDKLVEVAERDDQVGIVGPKLREWSSERILQEVGMTIDRLGRAESRLEIGEPDQGQHDQQREVLYVNTAGMLLRRDVFREVGGFDPRFALFRDDLDLCWRTWLTGMRVEIVPDAVAYHSAATSKGVRQVAGSAEGARYYAERHSIAGMLKNIGLLRMIVLVPALIAVGIVKFGGFLLTRRFGDAAATLRAYLWNLFQLPRTWKRRRQVQRRRIVSDGELARLFAPGLPRLRAYGEALGSWLAGGTTRALISDEEIYDSNRPEVDQGAFASMFSSIARHPVATAGIVLTIAYVIGLVPFLARGQIVGGDIAPWPADPREFFAAYTAPWVHGPLASGAMSSPIQVVFGVLAFLGIGSAWVAQRLVVFGLLPLAWLAALRAGRVITPRPGPRVVGATLYALNPVMLGGFAEGQLGFLILAALTPALMLVGVRAADAASGAADAWRSAALFSIGLVVAVGAEPSLAMLPAGLALLLFIGALLRGQPGRFSAALRMVVALMGSAAMMAPWAAGFITAGEFPITRGEIRAPLSLWRALGTVPNILPSVGGIGGWLVALTAGAVVVAAVMLGMRGSPRLVASLLLVWVLSALAAWGIAWAPVAGIWVPGLLLPAILAQAGLVVLSIRWASDGLAQYAFGGRQLATVLLAVVLLVGLGGGVARIADGPWDDLRVAPELVPPFVAGDTERVGPYRILLLSADAEGRVTWDVTAPSGPSATTFGSVTSGSLVDSVDRAVGDLVSGVYPQAGTHLGVVGVRYVVVPAVEEAEVLTAPLDRQPMLEPVPAGESRVYRVRTWMPEAALIPGDMSVLRTAGEAAEIAEQDVERLEPWAVDRWTGPGAGSESGLLVLQQGEDDSWAAVAGRTQLEREEFAGINAYQVPPGTAEVSVGWVGGGRHRAEMLVQLFAFLAVLSLALRPPGRRTHTAPAMTTALPGDLGGQVMSTDDTGDLLRQPAPSRRRSRRP